jgi:hypothetical protein
VGSKESGSPKYTPALHKQLVEYLRGGAFKKHAANACRLSLNTFEQWLAWGAAGREPYARLAIDCDQAIAQDAIRNQLIISKAANGEHLGDWKAAAWCLERKFPKLYGAMAAGHEGVAQGDKPFSPWKLTAVPNN